MKLREHQSDCRDYIMTNNFSRGKIILPTGTGKTFIEATLICDEIEKNQKEGKYGGVHVICCPRILLSLQLLQEVGTIASERNLQIYYMNVNSGEFASDELEQVVASFGLQVYEVCSTTSFTEIKEKAEQAKSMNMPIIIVSTYHSAYQIQMAGLEVGTWINDEAHYLVSNGDFGQIPKYSCNKMFFCTATPKLTDDEENGKGMQNVELFGEQLFFKSPKEMVDKGEMVKPAIHLVGVLGQDCSTDLSKDYGSQAASVFDVFNFHRKAIREHSSIPGRVGAKLVVVCDGQKSLLGIFRSKQMTAFIKENREQNKKVNLYALSSDFGIYRNGIYNRRADNTSKEKLMKDLKALKSEDEAIIFHVDMIAEGIDVPGITGVMPFRNMGKIKFLQNVGRASRLFGDDRTKLYEGSLIPRDFKNYIKPYAWIILPIFLGNSNDSISRYKEYIRLLRSEYGFDSSELILMDNTNGISQDKDFDEVAKLEKALHSAGQGIKNFVRQLEDEEQLTIMADMFFRTSLCTDMQRATVISGAFDEGCLEENFV